MKVQTQDRSHPNAEAARQAPLSIEFSRQEHWSGPVPPLGDLPGPGIEPLSPASPALVGGFFTQTQKQ